ncbi:hypothetical protein [Pseudomonas sp. NPDC089734]|uniref:hypothetical protein n=1 Tax=Pseudomonas sp. NPDC089734 TaxID=3364469 RepID=UPI00382DFBA6
MALMFFHIPRTGGSTVWHSLAGVAARQNKTIADLYHQSREITGHPFAPEEAVQYFHDFLKQTGLCFNEDVIYHHHTYQHVPYLLDSDQLQRVTLIRDPASRLVSEAFYMRRFIREEQAKIDAGEAPSEDYVVQREQYGEVLFHEMIAADVDPDALVLGFARHHQNYYLSYFSHFVKSRYGWETFDEVSALGLAQEVRQLFIWIGQFPALGEFMQVCGLLADLDISVKQDMQHITNGSAAPELKEETLAQIRAINKLDYLFTDSLLQAYDKRLLDRLIDLKEKKISQGESSVHPLNDELARQTLLAQERLDESATAERRTEELLDKMAASDKRIEALLGEIAASNKRIEELERYKSRFQAMNNSTSWRVTAPLRKVGSWMKR